MRPGAVWQRLRVLNRSEMARPVRLPPDGAFYFYTMAKPKLDFWRLEAAYLHYIQNLGQASTQIRKYAKRFNDKSQLFVQHLGGDGLVLLYAETELVCPLNKIAEIVESRGYFTMKDIENNSI